MLNQSEAATLGAAVAELVSSIRTIWTRSQSEPAPEPVVATEAAPAQRTRTAAKKAAQSVEPVNVAPSEAVAIPARAEREPGADAVSIVPDWAPGPPVFGATHDGNTMVCEPLRPHERDVVRRLKSDGPLPIGTLWRRCKVAAKWRQETLFDLHRMGWITVTDLAGPKRQTIIAATDKPLPPID